MVELESVKRGFLQSLHITWEFSKVIVPAYIAMTFLKHTSVFSLIASWAEPCMELLGLPGEVAMPITLGMLFNQYLAIGPLSAMNLTIKEITLAAVILCICHELLIESAVAKKVGVRILPFVLTRFAFAFMGAYILNILWTVI